MERTTPGDLLVAGHVNVDRFLRVARFPGLDRTEPVLSEREELGGTATTIARVARRLGLRTGLLARVGDGFPERFRAQLRRDRIDVRGLETVPGEPTPCCTIIEVPDGSTRTLIQQGPMRDGPSTTPGSSWCQRYRWVHLGTGPPQRTLVLAEAAQGAGRRVAFDPAQEIFYRWDRAIFRRVLARIDVLFGNEAEVAVARRWAGGPKDLLALVPLVVRTEGRRGATAFYRGGTVHAAAERPSRRRTLVGAGDAFRGGFYAGWLRGATLRDCLTAGNRTARQRIEGRL
ncbi:MAG TPA: PfkB family carbohydrate kinase [Thermoplasmata archaeon]|nr:PfkB family carbohydrate kinase [Thermoplasmata archaeon]